MTQYVYSIVMHKHKRDAYTGFNNRQNAVKIKSTDLMIKSIFLSLFMFSFSLSVGQVLSSGYINVGNDSIFFETSGSGKVIILIHDGLIHREVWDDQFSLFAKDFRIIRYDRRGYGKSSPASNAYSNLGDLSALFTQLKIDSACLIACSSGGELAIDFTLEYPQKIRSLVLVGAVVGGFTYTRHFYTRGGHLPLDLKDYQKVRLYYASDDPWLIYSENIAAKEEAIELIKNNPFRVYSLPTNNHQPVPAFRRLNEIKIPALILVGEFDIPDVHAHAGVINAGILNSRRIVIPESGHLIPMEQPGLFNETVMEFLNDMSK